MGFFRLLLRPRWRLFFFGLVALGLQIALLLISPAQVPVVLYKLALVMLAAILGMFFDVAVFPFATPDSYLDDDWKRAPGAVRLRCADFAIAKGYLWPFVMACLRRAAVVAAFVVAVSVVCENGGDGETPAKGRFPHGEVAHDDSHGFDDGAAVRAVSAAGAGVGYSARG